MYGRTGIKKGYNGLFLEKTATEAYAKLAATTTEADYNAATAQFQTILDRAQKEAKNSFEETYYASADVALLSDAFVDNAAELLLKRLKEPIREVKETFNPTVLLKNQPVLLIPSGALTGFNDSPLVKASLDEYVKQGGTLLVLSQKHGYDYASIPTPDGKPITGYGWEEDINCFADAFTIETWHQMLSGQSTATPTANVDGYFTSIPDNSIVLMRRTINSQPALFMYKHGAGRVIVTSMYSDWAYGHGQASAAEIALVRDMLSWAKKPAQLPEIKPGEAITVPVTLTNSTASAVAAAKLQIYNPDRSTLLAEQNLSLSIAAGQSAETTVNWQSSAAAQLGIFHVDYILLDSAGNVIQPQAETDSGRFVISSPPTNLQKSPDFNFAVNSDSEKYARGADAAFTVTMYNNTDAEKTITAKYFFPHHYWETRRTDSGGDWNNREMNLQKPLIVPAKGSASFSHVLNNVSASIDRLWAYFYDETGKEIGGASRGFWVFSPALNVSLQPDKTLYARGDTVNLTLNLQNRQSVATNGSVTVRVSDPLNLAVYVTTLNLALAANESSPEQISFPLPASAQAGNYTISAEAFDGANNKIGGDSAGFEIPLRLVTLTPTFPAGWQAGANPLSVNLANLGVMPVTTGLLGVTLTDPDGAAVATVSQPLTLDAGQAKNLDLSLSIPSLKFGAYTLTYNQGDEACPGRNNSVTLANRVSLSASFDKPSYRSRETAKLAVNLVNDGKFMLDNAALTVTVTDFGYSATQNVALYPNDSGLFEFAIPIPETASFGQHAMTVVISLPSGSIETRNLVVTIPESSLELDTLTQSHWVAGDIVRLSLKNAGGEDTTADFIAELYDTKYAKIAGIDSLVRINSGATVLIDFPIAQDLASGTYYLQTSHLNRKNNKKIYDFQEVVIHGKEVVLAVTTSKDWYQPHETVNATTAIAVNSGELANATLNLKVLTAAADQSLAGLKWWDSRWRYRQPLIINVGNASRENYPVRVDFNFTDEFTKSGKSGTFDENSLRVMEYDADGNILKEIPSQLDKAADYTASSNARGSVYWIMDGVTPAGSARRYAVYYDTLDNGSKEAAVYPVVPATLDNENHSWKTDGVYFKWGGYGYRSYNYLSDIITDLSFDDNDNNDPTDDLDRLQDSYAFGVKWYGYLGRKVTGAGFGSSTGIITKQGAVFVELTLGNATFRYYKNNKHWLECNGVVDLMFNFGSFYDYVKSGNKEEKNIISGSWFESYYGSPIQPGYLAYRASSRNVILGAIATNVSWFRCDSRLDPAYDRILSFNSGSDTSAARIYWYSDASGGYEKIGRFSENILSSFNLISGPTEIYSESDTNPVIWEKNIPINITGAEQVLTEIFSSNQPQGKVFLQGTLISGLNQVVVQALHPFYIAAGNISLAFDPDKRLVKKTEAVTISGKITNNASIEANNLVFVLKSKTAAGTEQVLHAETFTLPAGESRVFTVTTATGEEGAVTITGTVARNGAILTQIADRYEIASPRVTAAVTTPDIAGDDPFDHTLTLANSGRTDALVSVVSAVIPQPETVTIPAGHTKLIQYSRQISADTTDTFVFSGDLTQVVTKSIKYGPAVNMVLAPQALYPEGKIAIPVTVANSGLLDSQFSIAYQLHQGATITNQQTKSHFLAKGAATTDSLTFDLTEGRYQLAATSQNPVAASSATFQVRKEIKAELALSVGAQSGDLLPATVSVANLGFNPVEGSVRLSLVTENGLAAWTAVQEVSLPKSLNPEPRALAFAINLAPLKPGSYSVRAELLDAGNRQLAVGSAPFTLLGPTFVISQLPEYRTIPAGGRSDFTFRVKNSSNQEGQFDLSFKADDLIDSTRSEWLKPGEEKEIVFTFQTATDLEEKDYNAVYRLKTIGSTVAEGIVTYRLAGIRLTVTASLDKPAYTPGDTATLTLAIARQDNDASATLFARVNYNGYGEKREFALSGSQTLTFNVPLDRITGEKLFYGIYHQSGRSIHLNTIYIHKADATLAITTDRQVYNPGETVAITTGGSVMGNMNLTGPGDYSASFAFAGTDTRSLVLPSSMTAGTYTITGKLTAIDDSTINVTHPFDVAGIQVKVKEALLDKSRYAATDTMMLTLTIESNRDLAVTVRSWIVDPAGNYTPAGEAETVLSSSSPSLFTIHSSLLTGSLGIHKLVYGVYQGDLLLASGAKAFDIGEAVLLGFSTDRSDYPEISSPVTVKADLYGSIDAAIEFFLDGTSIRTGNVALSGMGNHTFAIPPAGVTPGLHTLKGVLTVNGLASSREVRFTYGSGLPDLVVRLTSAEPKGSVLPLAVTVTNQGKTAAAATTLVLSDGNPEQGGTTVAILTVPPLAAGASVTIAHDWHLLGKAGEHTLYGQVDPENRVAEFIEANNRAIGPVSIPNLTLGVSTGGASFRANSDVGIAVDLANLGSASYQDLTLKTEIIGPVGAAGGGETAIASLAPASEISIGNNWNTAANPPGNYRIESSLVGGGNSLVSGNAPFAVEETPFVTGTMSLGTAELIQGTRFGIDFTLANNGNIDLAGGETKVEIVDKNSGTTATFSQPFAQLKVLQSLSSAFAVEKLDIPPGDYAVKLTALVAGGLFPIGEKALKVLPSLEVIKQLSLAPRVLVFICKEEGESKPSQTEATIKQALDGLDVYYAIARDEKEFTRGLRGGLFNVYLLAGRKPLSGHLDRELAERINSGDGLILADYGPVEDGKFRDVAGIEPSGSIPAKPRVLTLLEGPMTHAGSFTVTGKLAKLRVSSSTAQVAASVADKGESHPLLVLHPYGEGKSVVFAFDPDVTLLQGAVGYVAPTRVDPIPVAPLPVELTLRSLGAQFDLKIVETVDAAVPIMRTWPQGTIEQQKITWNKGLGSNETVKLSYLVGLPEESGTFDLSSEVSYLRSGGYEFYKTYPLVVKADTGLVALKTDILVSLQGLAVPGEDTAKLNKVIGMYAELIDKPVFTEKQVDGVIKELLKLTDDLRGLRVDGAAVRLDFDRLLRIYGCKWSRITQRMLN